MWYFAWVLGLAAAVMFAVINAMWLEMREDAAIEKNAHDKNR